VSDLVDFVNPPGVTPPKGEYSQVAVLNVPAARLCFVTGQVGFGPGGHAEPELEPQMDATFENLRTVLETVGASLGTVLQLTTYLTSETLIDRYFAKRAELFPKLFGSRYPSNALVVVSALARPPLQIEVQAIAAIPAAADG
jgi:2-iminobutanoate/2-iminopropanoate deaminase